MFTAPFEHEVRVSADRRQIVHCGMSWSAASTPDEPLRWNAFSERMVERGGQQRCQADLDVLRKACDLLASELVGT